MWNVFQKNRSSREVARECGVHRKTAKRYRELEGWDERLSAIRQKEQQRADETQIKARAEDIRAVNVLVSGLRKAILSAEEEDIPLFDHKKDDLLEIALKIFRLKAIVSGVEIDHREMAGAGNLPNVNFAAEDGGGDTPLNPLSRGE